MNIRSWRGVTPLSPTTKRSFPWARLILVAALLGAAAYYIVPLFYYISADGLVQGDLVPVSPIYRVRIDKLLVGCSDSVKEGQTVAVVSNFLVQADYERELQQNMAQLQLSQVAQDQGVAQAQTNVAMLRQKFEASQHDAERLKAAFNSYDEGYRGGAISRIDWQSKRNEWLSAQALANSDLEAWHLSQQQVERIRVDNNERVSKNEQLTTQSGELANRIGHEELVAPVSGYVVNCAERPSNVIDPGKPLFSIFQPQRAYVLAYVDPSNAGKLYVNQRADISVPGIKQPLNGRITAIYPDLQKLPGQLTRYFWQHQQWSQYRPVRISLDQVAPAVRSRLYYGAQVRIKVKNG